jgi:hypothetical protein
MRKLMLGVLMLVAQAAWAEDSDAAFRDFVMKSAASQDQYVEALWSANLDTEKGDEHAAVVCPNKPKENPKGYFIVEKDASHRWEISFDLDSKTHACKGKPASEPKLEHRAAGALELRQDHSEGHEETYYAIRAGQPVIVKEVTVEKTGAKPVVKDWDQLVKTKKAKSYQAPDTVQPLNG